MQAELLVPWTDEDEILRHQKFKHKELEKEKYLHPANILS
jgi:hypothetical protein